MSGSSASPIRRIKLGGQQFIHLNDLLLATGNPLLLQEAMIVAAVHHADGTSPEETLRLALASIITGAIGCMQAEDWATHRFN